MSFLSEYPTELRASEFYAVGGSSVCNTLREPAWGTQELQVLGSDPAAVYSQLGLCATGVLRPV